MRKYTREQIDEHIQWLIKFMEDEYPNGFELVISAAGAEIDAKNIVMTFTSNSFMEFINGKNDYGMDKAMADMLRSCCMPPRDKSQDNEVKE